LGLCLVFGNQLQLDTVGENAEWIRYKSGYRQHKGGVSILLAGVGLSKKPENRYIMRTINDMGSKAEILSKWVGYDFPTAGGFLQKCLFMDGH
jgi:hypothetical protein